MTEIKSSSIVERSSINLVVLSWFLILAAGEPPAMIFRFFVPAEASEPYIPSWISMAQAVFLAGFWLISRFSSSLKPLGGFALALAAFIIGASFIQPAILNSSIFANWLDGASWGLGFATVTGLKLITVALMALTLVGSNIGRGELFLSRGNPRAPAQPSPFLPGLKESKPWNKVARAFLPYYAVGLLVILWLQIRPDASQFTRAMFFLPAIILAAAINAFSEEFQFRSMLISRLKPVIGVGQAVMMTSVAFGLGHFGPANYPNGIMGAVLAGYLGWVAAKSMVETRGMVWAFLLHFLGDFVIYSFVAMAAV